MMSLLTPARLASASVSPIGLDVGSRAVHAVQVRHRPGRAPVVLAAGSVPRDGAGGTLSADEAEAISAWLSRRGFVGRDVVIAMPAAGQVALPLQLPPPGSPAPREEIALAQAADAARAEASDLEFAWWDTPALGRASGPGSAGLGVAARRADVLARLEPLCGAGLEPAAVDAHALALARAAAAHLAPAPRQTALLDLGHSALGLIVTVGPIVAFQRTLPELGLAPLLERLAQHAGAPDLARPLLERVLAQGTNLPASARDLAARDAWHAWLQEAAREVIDSLAYTAGNGLGPPDVLLAGGGADVPGLPEALGAAVAGVRLDRLTLGRCAEASAAVGRWSECSSLVAALGLALHQPEAHA
jgi:Tfp pilus assembly PilM family ATPase